MRVMVELRPRQLLRRGHEQLCELERQRRWQRRHSNGRQPGGAGGNAGAGMHLEDVVGDTVVGSRPDLSGWDEWSAGDGFAVLGLFRWNDHAVHTTGAGPYDGGEWLEQLHADTLSALVQNCRRLWLGSIFSIHLRDVPQQYSSADL